MATYFVHRSPYWTPALNHLKRFEDATVLEWFRKHWQSVDEDEARRYVENLLGCDVYGFYSVFESISEGDLPPPADVDSLREFLEENLYVEGELIFAPHAIQVQTDDDELQLAYYIFDDVFVSANPGKADFLLQDKWELPTSISASSFVPEIQPNSVEPAGPKEGKVFCAFLSSYDSGDNLSLLQGAWQIDGIRLDGLAEYLGTKQPGKDFQIDSWPPELLLLRSQLLLAPETASEPERDLLRQVAGDYKNTNNWQSYFEHLRSAGIRNPSLELLERALHECANLSVHAMTWQIDWTQPNGRDIGVTGHELCASIDPQIHQLGGDNDPSKSRVQFTDHVAQASIHTDRWESWGGRDLYNRWIIFDDLWAAGNPALANSILRYASRWDVLSE